MPAHGQARVGVDDRWTVSGADDRSRERVYHDGCLASRDGHGRRRLRSAAWAGVRYLRLSDGATASAGSVCPRRLRMLGLGQMF